MNSFLVKPFKCIKHERWRGRKALWFPSTQVMQGWSKVSEDTGAMKSAFSAMKDAAAPAATAPKMSENAEDVGEPEYTTDEKQEAAKAAARRSLPSARYGDCNTTVPANGALRNEAFTSLW